MLQQINATRSPEDVEKWVVFAHHSVMQDAVVAVLDTLQIGYFQITGSTAAAKRTKMVAKFQEDSHTQVAVLSIQAAGTGFTLTRATKLFMVEMSFNTSVCMQAEDRIHRTGQLKPTQFVYCILNKSVEEQIWHLLQYKGTSASKVLDNGRSSNSWKTDEVVHWYHPEYVESKTAHHKKKHKTDM